MTTKETKVIVSAETSKYERNMKRFAAFDKKITRDMQYRWKKVKGSMRSVSVAALAFGVTFALAMKKSIDAASDLQETTSKFNVVFAGQVERAEKNAKILGDSYGLTREQAKRYLSSVQDLLVPMGVAADKAGRLSHEVVKLSADLGSFNNMPTERVMLDIQSALVGNFETMKKYGVVLNMTVVAEKAFAMGLADTKDELTAGMRAQAAYALMVEGSAAAIGDKERTMESYANQVIELNKNLSDLTAEIGEELLPMATEMVKSLNLWIEANEDLIKTGIVGFLQGVGIALDVLLEPLRLVVELFRTLPELLGSVPEVSQIPWSQADPSGVAGGTGGGSVLGISEVTMDKDLALLVTKEEEKFQIALNSQTRMEEMFATSGSQIVQMEIDREQRLTAATKEETEKRLSFYQGMASGMAGVFLQIAQAGGKQSLKAFRLYQAAAITEAIIAANLAAAKVLGQLGIFGIPLSSMVWAMAMANVAMIAAAKPPSYDRGGISTTPGIYYAGVPEAHIPLQSGKVPVNIQGGGTTIHINMINPVFEDQETRRQVFNELIEVGVNKFAPGAVVDNYNNDGDIRQMVRSRK